MTKGITLTMAAIMSALSASAAVAGDTVRMKNADGLLIDYRPARQIYCLRTHSGAVAARLGLRVHATECATVKRWARQGLTVARRSDAAAQRQVASAD